MSSSSIRTIALPFGERIPALGLGTWHMAEDPAHVQTDQVLYNPTRRGIELDRAFPPPAERRPLEML